MSNATPETEADWRKLAGVGVNDSVPLLSRFVAGAVAEKGTLPLLAIARTARHRKKRTDIPFRKLRTNLLRGGLAKLFYITTVLLLKLVGAAYAQPVQIDVYSGTPVDSNPNGDLCSPGSLDFSGTTYVGTIHSCSIDYPGFQPLGLSQDFGAIFTGELDVANTGNYLLDIGSDDASYLFLDGGATSVLSSPGTRSEDDDAGDVYLTAGLHSFELEYQQTGGGSEVNFNLPGGITFAALPAPELDDSAVAVPLAFLSFGALCLAGRLRSA